MQTARVSFLFSGSVCRYLDKLQSPLFSILKHAILLNCINGSIGCSTAQYAATIRTTLKINSLELHFCLYNIVANRQRKGCKRLTPEPLQGYIQ